MREHKFYEQKAAFVQHLRGVVPSEEAFTCAEFFNQLLLDELSDPDPNPVAMTFEQTATGEKKQVLRCGCILPGDVDAELWLLDHQEEHMAAHGLKIEKVNGITAITVERAEPLLLPQVAQSAQEHREQEIARAKEQWQQIQAVLRDVASTWVEAVNSLFSNVASILVQAFSPVVEWIKTLWKSIAPLMKRRRYSRQSRAFLMVKRRRVKFTPHAHKRRHSSRRLHLRQMQGLEA